MCSSDLTVLIPTLAPLFADAGVEPPFVIGFLLGVQQTLAAYWLPVLAGVAAVVVAPGAPAPRRRWRMWPDRRLLRAAVAPGHGGTGPPRHLLSRPWHRPPEGWPVAAAVATADDGPYPVLPAMLLAVMALVAIGLGIALVLR